MYSVGTLEWTPSRPTRVLPRWFIQATIRILSISQAKGVWMWIHVVVVLAIDERASLISSQFCTPGKDNQVSVFAMGYDHQSTNVTKTTIFKPSDDNWIICFCYRILARPSSWARRFVNIFFVFFGFVCVWPFFFHFASSSSKGRVFFRARLFSFGSLQWNRGMFCLLLRILKYSRCTVSASIIS